MASARDQADRLFSELVRSRGFCERCGNTTWLECAHIVTRARLATRTDESAAVCLCHICHLYMTGHPDEWVCWCIDRMGGDRYDALVAKSRQTHAGPDFAEEVIRLRRLLRSAA